MHKEHKLQIIYVWKYYYLFQKAGKLEKLQTYSKILTNMRYRTNIRIKKLLDELKIKDSNHFKANPGTLHLPENLIIIIFDCLKLRKYTSKNARRYSGDWILSYVLLYIRSSSTYKHLRHFTATCIVNAYKIPMKLGCYAHEEFLTALKKNMLLKDLRQWHRISVFDRMSVRESININVKIQIRWHYWSDTEIPQSMVDHALILMFNFLCDHFSQQMAVYGAKGQT